MSNGVKAAVFGFVVWLVGLVIIRILGASVFSEGNLWLVAFYASAFPMGIVLPAVMRGIINVPMGEMLEPIVIAISVALMLDGFSIGFTDFYGVGEVALYSAAYLLWTPGVLLLCALWVISRVRQMADMSNNIKAAAFGFVVWVIVVIIMRILGASVFSEGNLWMVAFYIASFPAGIVFTVVMRAIMNVPMGEMLQPMVIFAIVAVMLDGFSFGFTNVYGVGEHEVYSAAYLLWAPGVFLLCALWVIQRAKLVDSQ